MDKHTSNEVAVGAFVILGIIGLAYLSVSIGGLELFPGDRIRVGARFASVGDLKPGAAVKIAGVKVGSVEDIRLDRYAAAVNLDLNASVALPTDTIASIRTEGLLGESYVLLRPGGSEKDLADGDSIGQTEPAIDLIDLLVKYALQSGEDDEASDDSSTESSNRLPDLFE